MSNTWPSQHIQVWCDTLAQGNVVAAPAEGVYGYCCGPFNPSALSSLISLKARSDAKGLIVLIANTDQLASLCNTPLPPECLEAIRTYWAEGQPPTTLILPAKEGLPPLLTGGRGTLAVRLPHTPYMQEYLAAWGKPLVSSSLNLSGAPPVTEAAHIPSKVISLTLSAPLGGSPSRIYDPLRKTWLR